METTRITIARCCRSGRILISRSIRVSQRRKNNRHEKPFLLDGDLIVIRLRTDIATRESSEAEAGVSWSDGRTRAGKTIAQDHSRDDYDEAECAVVRGLPAGRKL